MSNEPTNDTSSTNTSRGNYEKGITLVALCRALMVSDAPPNAAAEIIREAHPGASADDIKAAYKTIAEEGPPTPNNSMAADEMDSPGVDKRPLTAEWNRYVQYTGFTDFGNRFGLPCDENGNGIVGRASSDVRVDGRAVVVSIKPGTSKEATLSMLGAICTAIEEHGGWEHSEAPVGVVDARLSQHQLDDEIPF